MKTKRTLLVAAGLSAIGRSVTLANAVDFRPLIVTDLGGTLRLVQSVPCDQRVDLTTQVTDGRIEMTPAQGFAIEGSEDKIFNLIRLTLFFKRFKVDGNCRGIRDSHKVTEIGVRLASAVSFRALAGGRNFYLLTIPKEQFLIYESIVDNGTPKTAYLKPSADVTGTIDMARSTRQLHIEVATQLRFRAGCDSLRCVIDEVHDGTQTADISGTIVFPEPIPATAAR